jgi:hypothetical protein
VTLSPAATRADEADTALARIRQNKAVIVGFREARRRSAAEIAELLDAVNRIKATRNMPAMTLLRAVVDRTFLDKHLPRAPARVGTRCCLLKLLE